MSKFKHECNECDHDKLEYCPKCRKVYCAKCGREWAEDSSLYTVMGTYPYGYRAESG